jgi:dTDP-4-amino-4,6-dideoxygalactose transaminase
MDVLNHMVMDKSIAIIEDAAQGIDAYYKGRPLGSIGDMGTFSFHRTKNISTGEGGALVLNDRQLKPRANVIFEKGTDRQAFINGEIDRYSWVDIGGSYEMSEHLKVMLIRELESLDWIAKERRRVYHRYMENLSEAPLQLPHIPDYSESNYHIFAVRLRSKAERARVIEHLKAKGIHTTFHYQPLHLSAFGSAKGFNQFHLPVTERVADTILRLPIYPALTDDHIDYISEALIKILEEKS